MIKTEELELLGHGGHKHVYQHPTDEDKVIKVMMRRRATANGARLEQNPIRANRHQGIYRQFRRELIQYLQLCKNHYKENQYIFPVESIYGFEPTDQGLGLVTEKISSPNGRAMTIEHIVAEGMYDEKIKHAFNQFFDDCCRYHIVFGEVNIGGIMYTESRQNRPEFVLVDGMGEKVIVPLRSMSKTINDHNIRKVEEKLKSHLQRIDGSITF